MKITVTAASRREEILQRKAEYDAKKSRNDAILDEQHSRFRLAQDEVFASVEDAIRTELGDNIGELRIDVDTAFGAGLRVQIGNDNGGPRRSDDASLTWRWTAMLQKDGQVKKESSSWSGLNAVTMDQIEDLKKSVQQLEIINTMDWKSLLDVTLPNWKDYVTEEGIEDIGPRPNFEQELIDADLEDALVDAVVIKAREGRFYSGDVYFKLLKDSGSQYTVIELPARMIDTILEKGSYPYGDRTFESIKSVIDYFEGNTYRIRKSTLTNSIYKPVQFVEY